MTGEPALATCVLQGRYELLELAGSGGQGEVWRARDVRHDRMVAVKLRDCAAVDPGRLQAEAGVLLSLQPHRNVPTVREDFYDGDRLCMVLDWVEGRNLRQILEDHGEVPVAFETALSILEQVAAALDHLHSHVPPIVHQDVKPANIVVTAGDRVVLVDFGIARTTTTASSYHGTPGYVAPEVTAGRAATAASDIFALGVAAYALLAGTLPEPGTTAELFSVPLEMRGRVRDVLMRAMAIDPMKRPATASALIAALRPATERAAPGDVAAQVDRAIASMDDGLRRTLEVASVVGSDFRAATIAAAAGGSDVTSTLVGAEEAGLIASIGGDRYAFTPVELRVRLYDDMMRARRAQLHARVGSALEKLHATELDPYLAEIAYHYCEAAGMSVSTSEAARCARQAAVQATRAHAYADAVTWFEKALTLDELAGTHDAAERCRTLLVFVNALWGDGQLNRAVAVARDAIPLARDANDGDLFVRAALEFAGLDRSFTEEREAIALLEEALDVVGSEDSRARAILLATLAAKLTYAMRPDRVPALSDEALAIARRLDNPVLVSHVLFHRSRSWTTPERTHERLAENEEAYALAVARGSGAERNVLIELITCLMELGDRERIDREMVRLEEAVRQSGHLLSMWYLTLAKTALCTVDGRLDEAERTAERALEIGARTQEPDALLNYGVQIALIRRDQGRFEDVEPLVRDGAARYPDATVWSAAQAFLECQIGDRERALERLRELPQRIDDIPRDHFWLVEMAMWADACAELRDVETAALIRDRLLPFGDRFAVLGIGAGIWSSIARSIAQLEDVLGNEGSAARWYSTAHEASMSFGALAESQRIRSRST